MQKEFISDIFENILPQRQCLKCVYVIAKSFQVNLGCQHWVASLIPDNIGSSCIKAVILSFIMDVWFLQLRYQFENDRYPEENYLMTLSKFC